MKNVDPGLGDGLQDPRQCLRIRGEPSRVVLLFPLRDPQDHRETGTHRRTDARYDFHREARAALEAAAILILAEIERLPEEGIQDVAVRSVDLDPIEAELTGVARAAGKAFDDLTDPAGGEGIGDPLSPA